MHHSKKPPSAVARQQPPSHATPPLAPAPPRPTAAVTYALVALAYLISVLVPSIYVSEAAPVPPACLHACLLPACPLAGPCPAHPTHTQPASPPPPSPLHNHQGLLALVGSTATVVFSYLFPALVVLKSAPTLAQRGGAGALIGLGGLMAATAIYNHLAGHSLE